MSDKTLWCIVGGKEVPFDISISTEKSISQLREIISEKIPERPHPHYLVLWKPKETIPLEDPDNGEPDNDDDLARRISNLGNFSQFAEKLISYKKVGHYFGNQDEDSISVIIQLPTSGNQQGVNRDSGLKVAHGSASNLPSSGNIASQDAAVRVIEAVATLSVTSDVLGMDDKFILTGRPDSHFSYPNAIFNHSLARLHYELETLNLNDREAHSNVDLLDVSKVFLTNMLKNYPDENSRWEACRTFFIHIFGYGEEPMRLERSVTPHGVWSTTPSIHPPPASPLPRVILEVNREKGVHPTLQCVKYYATICSRWVGNNGKLLIPTMFPVILIGLNGHSLQIFTALTLQRIVVNELLILDLKDGFDRNSTVGKLIRIALALKKCASELAVEYTEIQEKSSSRNPPPQPSSRNPPQQPSSRNPPQDRFFPQPTLPPSTPSGSTSVPPTNVIYGSKRLDLTGKSFELSKEPRPKDMRGLFTGTTDDRKRVVVKFTATYNEEVHKLLASEGLAPKLYSCSWVIGNLFMVVMERLDGMPLASYGRKVHQTAYQDIKNALDVLKMKNFVHGDLRAVNVIIVQNQKRDHARLIDFDWAGESGRARYPLTINKASLSKEWHGDVKAGGLIETKHDAHALEVVLRKRFVTPNAK